jgi:hypothetical protein
VHVNVPYKQTAALAVEIPISIRNVLVSFLWLHHHINTVFFYLSMTLLLEVLLYHLHIRGRALHLAETFSLALSGDFYANALVLTFLASQHKGSSILFWIDFTLPPIVPLMILNRF